MREIESVVAMKFGHLRLIHILITLVQYLEENYVLAAILLLLGCLGFFLHNTWFQSWFVLDALLKKIKRGNIACNIIWNQRLCILVWTVLEWEL